MGNLFLYLTIALSVVVPDVVLLIADKCYEKFKEEQGYKNNYSKKKLFKDDEDFDSFMRVYGAISLFVPGLNLITDYVLTYRRVYGITLNQEIKSGAIALEEKAEVIPEEDIEVIDTKDIADEDEEYQREKMNVNSDEIDEFADMLGELMFASMLAGMFEHMGKEETTFYSEPKEATEEDPYAFLKEFFGDSQTSSKGPRLRK